MEEQMARRRQALDKAALPEPAVRRRPAIVLALGAAAFIYLGVYNIAADEPHTPAVYSMLERLRDRSMRHARAA
jgi:hypothetical protein